MLASQLDAALAFRPELAIVAAGGNDALRRSFAPDVLERELDVIGGSLAGAGADVVMLELMDIVTSGLRARHVAGQRVVSGGRRSGGRCATCASP